ncbi:Phosphoglucomutase [Pseudomonas amygdali pv. ulmi]|uniref:Phosphoglucomutase n=2 Tax=Pseudomonas amygdali TaxID=47877 RepID=A0A0Q0D935_PSEA0|nr:Phosphoglucomutase [Pseudomonas amygdali pv. ulmi]RMR24672.1 Phosphoglucomutase [Pseudomonas amygdali pv. ulmi]
MVLPSTRSSSCFRRGGGLKRQRLRDRYSSSAVELPVNCRIDYVFTCSKSLFFPRISFLSGGCMSLSPFAGKLAPAQLLVDIPRLVTAYYTGQPDASVPAQRVAFGTSGHRGTSFDLGFNEWHVLAISQAICLYRKANGIDGPLFLGADTHALSTPAAATALEVLAANGVEVMISQGDEYTPTPAVSHAIICYNRGRTSGLADGVVITPSHNPPQSGGFKYNPPNGGPADSDITKWIENKANELLAEKVTGVSRISHEKALRADTTHRHDYVNTYVADLKNVIDLDAIRDSGLRLGVDPLGGAGVNYWSAIGEHYGLNLDVVNKFVDPTFRFMTVDWDGQIRMDPSSSHAMQSLIGLKDRYQVAFACDPDHDRHGIVTPSGGLMTPNSYLAVSIDYLFQNRPEWRADAAVGKTVVSSGMIDRVAARLGRRLYEVPVGFKYFAQGLFEGSLGFGGEESAGASFLRRDGTVWTTDKDGLIPTLLAAEMTARTGRDPSETYKTMTDELGEPFSTRVDAKANPQQKALLSKLSPEQVTSTELAGEPIQKVLSNAPGNDQAFGGVKVMTENGWFAARPSGTEDIYKIYAESFVSEDHLKRLVAEAQVLVDGAISPK